MPAVQFAQDRGIATLTLDTPENRNALSARLVGELAEHLTAVAADDGVRAVVLTHTGTTFCAGADLKEQTGEGGPQEGTRRVVALMRQIVELPKPVIARLDGHVRAGGIGLVGACDIAVARRGVSFALTEVRLGLAAAMISLTILPRMTERAASRYLLTGEVFDADAAVAAGLLTAAVDDLDAEIAQLCDNLRLCSPQGLAEAKPLTTRIVRDEFEQRAEAMQQLSARLFASDEAREGMTAFLQKRPPRWVT
ncbi:MAG: enoyl-CoA hydratase family protein [Jatrophihabitans sp.]|uniref:enoyl-CoA hydratase family protein n=1 Tax=Jatrophihabitans sp. TaxID=1932789 RepID=UPI003F806717